MEKEEKIKKLLMELKENSKKILELEKYFVNDVVKVALKYELYEPLMITFQPITIDGEVKICFDAFSSDILDLLKHSYDTKEQAIEESKKEFEEIQERNRNLSEEEKEWYYNPSNYEEILNSKIVIPKEIKDNFQKVLFSLDFEQISKMKIKNCHAREISGIGNPIHSIKDVIFYSEPACVKSCIELFNKNIVTTMNDTEGVIEDGLVENGKCFITCDYKSLSEENKKIFDELIKTGIARRFMDGSIDSVSIDVSCNREETVEDVSNKLLAIVSKLKTQDYLYGSQTLENFYENDLEKLGNIYFDLYEKHFNKEECTWDDVIMFAKDLGYYYDSEEKLLWKSKNFYDRHHRYIQNLKESEDEQFYDTHYENGVESVPKKM